MALNGPVMGGGAELLTAMDYVIAAESSKIGFVHAKLGVSPGWGGGSRLMEKIGQRHALISLLTAKCHTPNRWLELGLVDEVVQNGEALASAFRLAKTVLDNDMDAVLGILGMLKGGRPEADVFLSLWGGDAHKEALGLKS